MSQSASTRVDTHLKLMLMLCSTYSRMASWKPGTAWHNSKAQHNVYVSRHGGKSYRCDAEQHMLADMASW